MRADADRSKLEKFMDALGGRVRGPGTVYLTGGATALLFGWRERGVLIRKAGGVEFRHFDFYSQALAKLERGHERDALDVRAFLDQGLVDRKILEAFFEEIRPGLKRFPAIDEAGFAESVRKFCAQA